MPVFGKPALRLCKSDFPRSQLTIMQSIFSLAVRRQRMYAGREHRRSRAGELKMD